MIARNVLVHITNTALVICTALIFFWVGYFLVLHHWFDQPFNPLLSVHELLTIEQAQAAQTGEIKQPAQIHIPTLNRTLSISPGFVENDRWLISPNGVSYLTTSGKLGQKGNAVLYGHNTAGLLDTLWKVRKGDFVEITSGDGQVYKYQIFDLKEVKPNQVEILKQTSDARVTIYTCIGFLDSARLVVVGKLVA